jgi:hypothetical protein
MFAKHPCDLLLTRSVQELPEARLRTARAGVWRRIYIHDE